MSIYTGSDRETDGYSQLVLLLIPIFADYLSDFLSVDPAAARAISRAR
jgi:hypothetical protein